MTEADALAALDFGSVNSESEEDLDRLFVRTGDFDKFLRSNVWLALGAKGTGKSALFELFTKFEDAARRLSGAALNDVIIAAGTGFGDLSEVATGDLQALRDANEGFDHDRLWRLYIAIKAGLAIPRDMSVPRGPLRDLLTGVGDRRDFRVGPVLAQLWTVAIGSAPQEMTITAGGASIALRGGKRSLDVVTLLEDVNTTLTQAGKTLWLLFDKVDEIWPADRIERRRALEGLMTASMQIRRQFPAIQPKVMLRTDLWSELDFTNKDHLTDKRIELGWGATHLTNLLVKRGLRHTSVRDYVEARIPSLRNREIDDWTSDERLEALTTILPTTAYPGEREAEIMDWLVERVKDGRQTVLPRDSIVLTNTAAEFQRDRGEPGSPWLLSREVVREAFTRTSEIRNESFLAEFPDLRDHFRRFSGQTRADFTRAELLAMFEGLEPSGEALLERLFEIGIIRPNTGRVQTSTSYEIPRLYRTGLGLIIRGRP
ncbi:hypothetical protein QE418_003240 [Microbacterium testaceum]|uniref:P-loop ATPase, Sll1717 family n=1 Tax=Microbacterium TaxID=33882 RepID=UPI0027805E58|nr:MULTISPECIES: hypothetical protein [Microbacterium]MDQ1113792.1 hypothetical protein [Microbacterium testaceum]MDR6099103.1 hypothetical protein [Microbacterium sp. SORGH_AS_0454]